MSTTKQRENGKRNEFVCISFGVVFFCFCLHCFVWFCLHFHYWFISFTKILNIPICLILLSSNFNSLFIHSFLLPPSPPPESSLSSAFISNGLDKLVFQNAYSWVYLRLTSIRYSMFLQLEFATTFFIRIFPYGNLLIEVYIYYYQTSILTIYYSVCVTLHSSYLFHNIIFITRIGECRCPLKLA